MKVGAVQELGLTVFEPLGSRQTLTFGTMPIAAAIVGIAFVATLIAFFIAEIGDKTQVATVALAAGYSSLAAVVAGTTAGMLAANVPVVFMGKAFAEHLPMKAIHYGAAGLFVLLGCVFILRALMH